MDAALLNSSCKQGDLSRVKYLVEQREVEINSRDKWDSSPLYYACLCGHEDIVRYLLENGAHCEPHTFDGERCLYGALNIEIRNLLRNYKVISSQLYKSGHFISTLHRIVKTGENSDVQFVVQGEELYAHRCILSCRSSYFNDMFHNKWRDRSTVYISNSKVQAAAFRALLRYIYTDEIEVPFDDVDSCVLLAKQCQLPMLEDKIDEAIRKTYSFACTKPGTRVTTISVPPKIQNLQMDFSLLAYQAIPKKFHQWVDGNVLPFLPQVPHIGFEDVCVIIDDYRFFCHKVFLCGRSDYFKVMFKDHFSEAEYDAEEKEVTSIRLRDVKAEVFMHILNYIYQDFVELTEDVVFDTLCAADMYLLPGLSKQCANYFMKNLTLDNCMYIYRLSRLFQLARLESQTIEFFSNHIFQLVDLPEFEELVKEDAASVIHREEVDSVPLLDDVRYHITSNVQTMSAMDEANDKRAVIDELIERLELDG